MTNSRWGLRHLMVMALVLPLIGLWPVDAGAQDAGLTWVIADSAADCVELRNGPALTGTNQPTMRRDQVLCVLGDVAELTASAVLDGTNHVVTPAQSATGSPASTDSADADPDQDPGADPNPVDVPSGSIVLGPVPWTEQTAENGLALEFGLSGANPTERATVRVRPAVGVQVSHRHTTPPPQEAGSGSSSGAGEGDQGEGSTATVPAEQTASIKVGEAGVIREIRLTGPDADQVGTLGNLTVRDDFDPALLRAEDGDGNHLARGDLGIDVPGNAGDGWVYRLRLASGANDGETETQPITRLFLGTWEAVVHEQPIVVDSPRVDLSVQAAGEARQGTSILVIVRVDNDRDIDLPGPLEITLTTTEATDAVSSFDSATPDGRATESAVTWLLDGGLRRNEEIRLSASANLAADTDQTSVTWQVTVAREGQLEPLDADVEITDLSPSTTSDDDSNRVEFEPGQLVQLIAFVVAFAIMAIVFGAWSRTRRGGTGQAVSEEMRAHELNVFRSYSEAILVLVIVVAVLVLALRGSLNGESAASLIGVIAGYALGQGMKR